ncbi:MAG: ErfK/YbiS/YcfS/YnhG superfamily protein [Candidatus Yanofskybacteria bacterium GW2011_GWE1_40_10]|uniref:ErfK/YbiS/YcfS/YnhG superfamily protein n=1 Tax=Candidatus Yanofskybacteria bacterium GW2011_GWE2_40_11 TaxID=1619033 RepID=A0A0G0TRL1_9BACT|nr:MAG: ErfK/YbiS/YcfS/YnhG superfamily protein [Candidatus Yanofskybacteria bacterium GW2011_GWE1_40_10]KKR40507.1 MAG: ErfK/YbiS/YcfS/YnhG superfamily protein [Candidatus Yanofskybacteria bacterium GW2011_GWE2_40_11]
MRNMTVGIMFFLALSLGEVTLAQESSLSIRIKLSEFRLDVYDGDIIIANFDIATPAVMPKNLPVEALIRNFEMNPRWYPTELTREYYLKRRGIALPKVLEFGDPRNAMGRAIIRLDFIKPGVMPSAVAIHGTNDEKSIGTSISRGCIRMRNVDVEGLVNLIGRNKARVIFEK